MALLVTLSEKPGGCNLQITWMHFTFLNKKLLLKLFSTKYKCKIITNVYMW